MGPHNAIVAMIVVYSAECFSTQTRGRGTGVVAAATKIAGIAAPYFITTILSYGLPWQLSVVVSQTLCCLVCCALTCCAMLCCIALRCTVLSRLD